VCTANVAYQHYVAICFTMITTLSTSLRLVHIRCTALSAADFVTLQVESVAALALLCFTPSGCELRCAVVLGLCYLQVVTSDQQLNQYVILLTTIDHICRTYSEAVPTRQVALYSILLCTCHAHPVPYSYSVNDRYWYVYRQLLTKPCASCTIQCAIYRGYVTTSCLHTHYRIM
jgi:hypothetical protein